MKLRGSLYALTIGALLSGCAETPQEVQQYDVDLVVLGDNAYHENLNTDVSPFTFDYYHCVEGLFVEDYEEYGTIDDTVKKIEYLNAHWQSYCHERKGIDFEQGFYSVMDWVLAYNEFEGKQITLHYDHGTRNIDAIEYGLSMEDPNKEQLITYTPCSTDGACEEVWDDWWAEFQALIECLQDPECIDPEAEQQAEEQQSMYNKAENQIKSIQTQYSIQPGG